MFNILTLNNISQNGLKHLPEAAFAIHNECKSPEGILLRSFNMHDYDMPDSLLAVARAGAGVNNVPVDACTEKGIVVFNTPGANANAVKELAIAGLLLSSRKIVEGMGWVKTLKGKSDADKLVEKGKAEFTGPEIMGKTLGVVGLGAIGVLVANAARHLGMEVQGYDPYLSVDSAWELSRTVKKSESLEALISECDYISIHVPLSAKTKGMFNDSLFDLMKNDARLLNFARAELVDTESLKKALEKGIVYVTDFPTADVLELDGVLAIPHLGASTPESEENCAEMAAMQLKDYLEYGIIKNSVNFPDCTIAYTGRTRVTITHKNIPGVVGAATTVLSKHNMNIENMISMSKGNWAYSVIDVEGSKNDALIIDLKKVDGVANVRII